MKTVNPKTESSGNWVPTINGQKAFVPDALPAKIKWNKKLATALSNAASFVGRLNGAAINLPNPDLLIGPFIRKEAELSSRIEGTVATMQQIYLFEIEEQKTEKKTPDVKEVANYIEALKYGLSSIQKLPVCIRLAKQLHAILLKGVRGQHRAPGQFRKTQNWIGTPNCSIKDATFIPPPITHMLEALNSLEKFINSPLTDMPVLVWLAMVHYQFEAIHPFLDGNGRIGRLLITLLLCEKKLLDKPYLNLSAYFYRNREKYYDYLLDVSLKGKWEQWILFFLTGITEQSIDAFNETKMFLDLQQKLYKKIRTKKTSALQLRLVDLLLERPFITSSFVKKRLHITHHTAQNNINKLTDIGVLKEITGGKRNKIYIAKEVLDIINKPFDGTM